MSLVWRHLRGGATVALSLLVLLAINIALSVTALFAHVWAVQAAIIATTTFIILWFSMDVGREQPLVRLFAALGFFWVAILFGLTFIDILTR